MYFYAAITALVKNFFWEGSLTAGICSQWASMRSVRMLDDEAWLWVNIPAQPKDDGYGFLGFVRCALFRHTKNICLRTWLCGHFHVFLQLVPQNVIFACRDMKMWVEWNSFFWTYTQENIQTSKFSQFGFGQPQHSFQIDRLREWDLSLTSFSFFLRLIHVALTSWPPPTHFCCLC